MARRKTAKRSDKNANSGNGASLGFEATLWAAAEYKHAVPGALHSLLSRKAERWARLARNLKAEIDEELIEAYRGTISLPFEPGDHKRVAVKIIDDRGIESLKIVEVG